MQLAQGIIASVKNGKLVLEIDCAQDLGPSKSGKTQVVASTHGFAAVAVGDKLVKLSLNVVK